MDLSGTLDKLGVGHHVETLGANANLRSWWKPYNPGEREIVMAQIRASYDQFIERVAKARAMTPERVDRIARGRVWSGVRAMDQGLVDAYGGLREAILRARATAGLRPLEGDVAEYPKPPGVLANLRALFGIKIPNPLTQDTSGHVWGDVARFGMGSLPSVVMALLRHIPASLWMTGRPHLQALGSHTLVIDA